MPLSTGRVSADPGVRIRSGAGRFHLRPGRRPGDPLLRGRDGPTELLKRLVTQRIFDPPAASNTLNDIGIAEDLQVVAEHIRGNRDVLQERAHAGRAPSQDGEDRDPTRIGHDREQGRSLDRRLVQGILRSRFSLSRSRHEADREPATHIVKQDQGPWSTSHGLVDLCVQSHLGIPHRARLRIVELS